MPASASKMNFIFRNAKPLAMMIPDFQAMAIPRYSPWPAYFESLRPGTQFCFNIRGRPDLITRRGVEGTLLRLN
jgi:hypothetical protein